MVVREVTSAVSESKMMTIFAKNEFLGTAKRRAPYVRREFPLVNPTPQLKHKMCAVYWVIANIPAKYRSTLNSIQLALLCNTSTVKKFGYANVLQPFICDLKLLE